MSDCIFCKIVADELPSSKVYEDEHVVAFLDIMPIHPGHVLVVPKQHTEDVFDTGEETLAKLFAVAKKLAPAVVKATKADGINIGINNKKAAGQDVFHIHLHVIPRYADDGLKNWPQKTYENDAVKKGVAEAIRGALS
jgi:histidine triad (HIT) family protein